MKRLISTSVFAALLLAAFYRDAESQSSFVRQLAPGVYARLADDSKRIIANSGWVVFRDYVLVIDANYPWGAREILKDIRRTTNKPVRFKMDVATLIPGHGGIGNRDSITPQRTYIAAMIDGIEKGIEQKKTAEQIAESLDLTRIMPNGADAARNQASILAVYPKLKR